MDSIKLMIADDHQILLDGLHLMLSGVPDIEIVTVASDGDEVLSKMKSHTVDVIMMDIQMPNKDGFETVAELMKTHPSVRILILSMHSEKAFIERMFQLGVMG